jgi:hypothetical protein
MEAPVDELRKAIAREFMKYEFEWDDPEECADAVIALCMEEAARVAEEVANEFKDATDGYSIEGRLTGLDIAAAIRGRIVQRETASE